MCSKSDKNTQLNLHNLQLSNYQLAGTVCLQLHFSNVESCKIDFALFRPIWSSQNRVQSKNLNCQKVTLNSNLFGHLKYFELMSVFPMIQVFSYSYSLQNANFTHFHSSLYKNTYLSPIKTSCINVINMNSPSLGHNHKGCYKGC